MLDREASVPTYMGNFLAIPHGTNEAKHQSRRSALSVIRYDEPVERCSGCSTPRPPPSCVSGCRRSTHHKAVIMACENAINATDQLYDEVASLSSSEEWRELAVAGRLLEPGLVATVAAAKAARSRPRLARRTEIAYS